MTENISQQWHHQSVVKRKEGKVLQDTANIAPDQKKQRLEKTANGDASEQKRPAVVLTNGAAAAAVAAAAKAKSDFEKDLDNLSQEIRHQAEEHGAPLEVDQQWARPPVPEFSSNRDSLGMACMR